MSKLSVRIFFGCCIGLLCLSAAITACKQRIIRQGSLLSRNSEVIFSFNQSSGDFEVQVSSALASAGGELRYLISRNPTDQRVDCEAAGVGDWVPGTSRGSIFLNAGQTVYPLLSIGNEIWLQAADPVRGYAGHGKLSPAAFASLERLSDTFVGEACVTAGNRSGFIATAENSVGNGAVTQVVAAWDGGADTSYGANDRQYGAGLVAQKKMKPKGIDSGKSDGSAEMQKYAQACTAEMGAIPALDCFGVAKLMLITTTWPDGMVDNVTDSNYSPDSTTCDKPIMLQNSCAPHSRFAAFTGDRVKGQQPTQWAYFCRRYEPRPEGSRFFDDVNMIGHNPNTGATCFFNSTLGSSKGVEVASSDMSSTNPRPASTIPNPGAPDALKFWYPAYHEDSDRGIGSVDNIQCARCHDNDAFLNSPFVEQAKTLPYGKYSDPDSPYYAVLFDSVSKNESWRPRHIAGEDAAGCTSCHRIGSGSTCSTFATYAADPAASDYAKLLSDFGKTHPWMPPERTDDGKKIPDDIQKSLNFIYQCCSDQGDASCKWTPVPR